MTTLLDRSVAQGEPEPLLSVKQVAAWLGMKERTIYRKAENGEIPAYFINGRWRFKQSEVDLWIGNQRNYRDG